MHCIIGLGNPGPEYCQTRHNAGFLAVDHLAEKLGVSMTRRGFQSLYASGNLEGKSLLLVKPQTFMNLSGEAVKQVLDYYKISSSQIMVVYDDLDLPLGALRFRTLGSAGGHKGMKSIIELLQTEEFARLRLGIGRPPQGVSVTDYVLTRFSALESPIMAEMIQKAGEAAMAFICQGSNYTMNHYNVMPGKPRDI